MDRDLGEEYLVVDRISFGVVEVDREVVSVVGDSNEGLNMLNMPVEDGYDYVLAKKSELT